MNSSKPSNSLHARRWSNMDDKTLPAVTFQDVPVVFDYRVPSGAMFVNGIQSEDELDRAVHALNPQAWLRHKIDEWLNDKEKGVQDGSNV